jgi:lysophospholipase L1-like esterase
VASLIVAGCGGGGGGGSVGDGAGAAVPATAGPAAAPAPAAFAGPPSIAMWGDSLTPGIASAFGYLWDPPRQIFNGGIAGQTSPEIAARATADADHRDWITIFWMGHNNDNQPEQIKADIAASVAHLAPGNNHFIVLSVLNKADGTEDRGSPRYNTIVQLNKDLAAAYGDNFLDIRSFMVGQSDPNNAEQADELRRDLPSSNLRFDGIHLTGGGDEVVGRRLIDFIRARGW